MKGVLSVKLIKHQNIPLWKKSKLVCSFKDGFIIPINNASRFFLIWLLDGVLHNIDQSNKRPIWFFIYCAGSDLWIGLLRSDQHVVVSLWFLLHNPHHTDIYCSIFCMLDTFFVFQTKQRTQSFCVPTKS